MASSGTDTEDGDLDLLAFGTHPARRSSNSSKRPPRLQRVPTESEDELLHQLEERLSMNVHGNNNGGAARSHSNIASLLSEDLTLRQAAARACKRVDVGTAVMPQPLFVADVEDGYGGTVTEHPAAAAAAAVSEQQREQSNSNDDDDDDAASTEQDLLNILPPDAPSRTSHGAISPARRRPPAELLDNGTRNNRNNTNSTTTHYARMVEQEFNAVVIEHHLKWAPLCTDAPLQGDRLGRYDFHQADRMVDWCRQHNIEKIKGHVLVWHVTSPTKLLEAMEPEAVRDALKRHIFTVLAHFRGRISTWDVCNECLAPDGTLAETVFYQKLGPNYIEDCFRWAHQADPDAVLLYNDNKVEGVGTPKADGLYHLLADLKAKGVPVHGVGLQAHFNAAGTGRNRPPTPHQVRRQVRRLGALGLAVNISEMDVRVSKLPLDKPLCDAAQRQIYHDILAAALAEPALDGIWLWGFTDRHTWVHAFYYDDEPCILDESYRRKEAYFGVRDALLTLTPGGVVGGKGVLLDEDVDKNGSPWGFEWMQQSVGGDEMEHAAGSGDARPDWEQSAAAAAGVPVQSEERSVLDSGDEADVENASNDYDEDFDDETEGNDDIGMTEGDGLVKEDLPPIS